MIFDTNLTLTSGYDDEDTFGKLKPARQGSHCIIVYRDLPTLRKIYSQYTERQIEEKMKSFSSFHTTKSLAWLDTCYHRWLQ
jgi:hypothetical protein